MNEDKLLPVDSNSSSNPPFTLPFTVKDTALICETDGPTRANIVAKLTPMGYQLSIPSSPADAIKEMKFHIYDLVLLRDYFGASVGGHNEILAYLESLPMNMRRRMFVALISCGLLTNDRLMAFYKSVNIIINQEKIDDLDVILKSALDENSSRYHVFREVGIKAGRI